ncbi:FAD dependent oxidoreductase [Penicillium sp. DV-2018c]|nr:FAD dependent oxidoreductase [Penicillium sp. DV-2018c]KAJ5583314.1 FAD dependent oxidoreductase [Penicillium sp. DV-2018c]
MAINKTDSILIVGAGAFGLSTALELNKRGYTNITVVDRFVPPSADGSSVDISRIIRADYADPVYSQMAQEALAGWATEYKDQYFESGFAMLSQTPNNHYIEESKANILAAGGKLDDLPDATDLRKLYPGVQANLSGMNGYHNPKGGWANAAGSIQQLASKCTVAGVSIIAGPRGTVVSLRRAGSRVIGVNLIGGQVLLATQVILSTGAWTHRLLNMGQAASSSGQPVGFIQLTEEEAVEMRKIPVMINMTTGVFSFPPTPDTHVLKLARHGYGYATDVSFNVDGVQKSLSSPKFESSNAVSGYIPDDADEGLREGLRQLFPKLGDRPWLNRRLCWYTDTPKGDFIIDHHPDIPGLFIATGGSGHGFKFLPVLGKYIADCFENIAPEALRQKWRMNPPQGDSMAPMSGDGSRGGPPLRKLSPLEQAKL